MYEPFVDDIERQREALTGLAVAEGGLESFQPSMLLNAWHPRVAARLLAFSSRQLDHYARLNATESAAHTASYIFYQVISLYLTLIHLVSVFRLAMKNTGLDLVTGDQ